jgi:hypothetical protein
MDDAAAPEGAAEEVAAGLNAEAVRDDDSGDGDAVPLPPVPWFGKLAVAAFLALVACTNLAAVFWPKLVNDHPTLVMMLSSRNRFLALAIANDVSAWSYATIAPLRIAAAAAVCHMLGRAYGDRAMNWFIRFLGVKRDAAKQMTAQFDKAELVLVPFFVGSNTVWLITGIVGSRWRKLLPLMIVGLAARLGLIWWLSKRYESELDAVLDFTQRYQWPLLIVSVVIVSAGIGLNLRRGRNA